MGVQIINSKKNQFSVLSQFHKGQQIPTPLERHTFDQVIASDKHLRWFYSSSYSQGRQQTSSLHSEMDLKEKKAAKMSVPQFGGWENNAPGATNYSVVFTQARENKKHQKTDLSDVKRRSIGKEQELMYSTYQKQNNRHHHHSAHHVPVQAHAHEDPAVMGKRRMLTYINCCIRP